MRMAFGVPPRHCWLRPPSEGRVEHDVEQVARLVGRAVVLQLLVAEPGDGVQAVACSRGDVGRYGEVWGGMGRCGEMWGDVGRYVLAYTGVVLNEMKGV